MSCFAATVSSGEEIILLKLLWNNMTVHCVHPSSDDHALKYTITLQDKGMPKCYIFG